MNHRTEKCGKCGSTYLAGVPHACLITDRESAEKKLEGYLSRRGGFMLEHD